MIVTVNRKKYYLYPVDDKIINNKIALSAEEKEKLFKHIDKEIVKKYKMVIHMTNIRNQAIRNFKNLESEITKNNFKKLKKAN